MVPESSSRQITDARKRGSIIAIKAMAHACEGQVVIQRIERSFHWFLDLKNEAQWTNDPIRSNVPLICECTLQLCIVD